MIGPPIETLWPDRRASPARPALPRRHQSCQTVFKHERNLDRSGIPDWSAWMSIVRLATETEMSMQHTAKSKSDLDILLQLNRDYIRSVQISDVRRFGEKLADDLIFSNLNGSQISLKQPVLLVNISHKGLDHGGVRNHTRADRLHDVGRSAVIRQITDVRARRERGLARVSAHVARCQSRCESQMETRGGSALR
jgi:hypothetical protein